MNLDLSQFFGAFFEEAEELLVDMERLLLNLDVANPSSDDLNAIFRCAHSIKGGAATFGFTHMTELTHVAESILDRARTGTLQLRENMVDAFLETKDVLKSQLDAYRQEHPIDTATLEYMVAKLNSLAAEDGAAAVQPAPAAPVAAPAPVAVEPVAAAPAVVEAPAAAPAVAIDGGLDIKLIDVSNEDCELIVTELKHLGTLVSHARTGRNSDIVLQSSCTADDIIAVSCFIIDADQIVITPHVGGAAPAAAAAAVVEAQVAAPTPAAAQTEAHAPAANEVAAPPAAAVAAAPMPARPAASEKPAVAAETSIRVGVEKVDQLINLVGELVITQAMLAQTASSFDPVLNERLFSGLSQLTRNARDLQEAAMSIRMMPMDYVFNRFPRLVRDLAHKLGKQVELSTFGKSTELDKGLIERIIDPLTHLVRNSLDHGIELPEARVAAGKDATGQLLLSAAHQGGNIVIEVSDDGQGLNRDKILKKARERGLPVSDNMTDDEINQLIFAPGFSTADQVTDVSGRGVGMDVVKQNIQSMGGYVEIQSQKGKGTTIRIVLPLTLAILDGMSVKTGDEVFILPLSCVAESLQPRPEDIKAVPGGGRLLKVRNEYLTLVPMYERFRITPSLPDPSEGIVVILDSEGKKIALQIDELVGQQQVVVKNLETNYRRVPGISGATILGDGSVALIVDVSALMRETRAGHSENAMRAVTAEKQEMAQAQGGRFSTEAMAAA
ncbi:chemotaxis protein CheA [Ralstonia insidiosa]|jgi:two-component system chemotaxis sensor kinase CheA|uniref:chemotaxis protein CheA n=1 Tax=Ralstonia TaxID=48736 RepID=UPI0006648450|nr:chemotaxis protein CheA [Ralstonia insidiosa]KMW46720.1 chemotaxis protein CheA [Ralstonia sp. MD27]MBX3771301.1 chemotaxis protein CheA [Ralstonia pickettii]NPA01821.1 chemotaxis protein CheA [Betaproteobacteria bacterium]MBA9855452.1 chemotaxis protein CheA [Ralstonia insidiosa]MBA9869311.1 chemotaxis protein CheA [Ralstonia insidiosa]